MGNDSGVVTHRDPDTVRGADVMFYSYARLPRGPLPKTGYFSTSPDLVVEVRSPGDGWGELTAKVSEYLKAGVTVVAVLDPRTESLTVYRADEPPQTVAAGDEFTLPDLLGEFRAAVRSFFD
jgi:Uma2 family endonuclease